MSACIMWPYVCTARVRSEDGSIYIEVHGPSANSFGEGAVDNVHVQSLLSILASHVRTHACPRNTTADSNIHQLIPSE